MPSRSGPRKPLPPLTWWSTMRWATVAPLLPGPGTLAVEFGCGLGAYGARFARRFATYQGIEPDQDSANVARSRVEPFGGQIIADPTGLAHGSAGLVCAFEVLEHLPDDRQALAEWVQYAAPGATVIVSVPAEPERFGPWDERVGHYRRYSSADLADLLRAAGLTSVEARHYGFPFGYALEFARNTIARRRRTADLDVPFDK